MEPRCENEQAEQIILTSDLQEKLSCELKVIQADLTACNDCWEEAINRTEKIPAKDNLAKGTV